VKNLFISFSGGETSAFMTLFCLERLKGQYNEVKVIYANSGQENEETLVFIDRFSREYGIDVVWVEAVVNEEKRKGTGHRVVTFDTACRDGKVFEDVIKKYGIPNNAYPHCTRELKLAPMTSYCRGLGWEKGSYDVAIGIRVDEIDRMADGSKEAGIIYPLISMRPTTKPEINTFWEAQPFRLSLKGYQGNCKTCWKKSFRKLATIYNENPSSFDFFREMEKKYSLHGQEFERGTEEGYKRAFFRNYKTVDDIQIIASSKGFVSATDDAVIYSGSLGFDEQLDLFGGDCTESCDILSELKLSK
jgi:hypothetical protein